MKKVIYILSVGHSGSTLLDIILGQFKNTFSTGELKHLTWQYYRQITNNPNTQNCTCGETFDKCDVWSSVISDLAEYRKVKENAIPEKVLIKHFDSLSFYTNFKKDKVLRFIYKWNLKNKIIPINLFHKHFNKINENNCQLFQSIYKQNKAIDYIIDSSKDIIRLNELKTKNSIFPIILIRNIHEVMNSKYVKNPNKTYRTWQKYYNNCLPLLKNLSDDEFHIISYELFINDPYSAISDLANKLKLNMKDFKLTINMSDYHLVAGNPMRYEKEISIRQKNSNKKDIIKQLKLAGLNNFYLERI